MKLPQIIRSDIAASAMAHLSVLLVVVFLSEVHPFSPVAVETVAVDIVTPRELDKELEEKKPEPPPSPDAFGFSPSKPEASKSEAPKSEASKPESSKPEISKPDAPKLEPFKPEPRKSEASKSAPSPAAPPPGATAAPKQAARPPDPPQTAAAQPDPPGGPPTPDYVAPQPDLTVKYQVQLGLPPDPTAGQAHAKSGDGFDDEASKPAEVSSELIAEFRRHLRTCSKLLGAIAPSDKVKVKLRALMTPDGKLATEPILIEASASMKGPILMQSAVAALKACQPYAMLPADRYGEWKVLDLSFTPQDFTGG